MSTDTIVPTIDKDTIQHACGLFLQRGQIVEVRTFGGRLSGPSVICHTAEQVIAACHDFVGCDVGWVLNELPEDFHGTAGAGDILSRSYVIVDYDGPNIETLFSARDNVRQYLRERCNFPTVAVAVHSGGGLHDYYRSTLAADGRTDYGLRRLYENLQEEFGGDGVTIDPAVRAAALPFRIPGTVNVKRGRQVTILDEDPAAGILLPSMLEPFTEGWESRAADADPEIGTKISELRQRLLRTGVPLIDPEPHEKLYDGQRAWVWDLQFDPIADHPEPKKAYVGIFESGAMFAGSHRPKAGGWGWDALADWMDAREETIEIDDSGLKVSVQSVNPQAQETQWPALQDLPAAQTPGMTFRPGLLPDHLTSLCLNVQDRLGSPAEYAACCVLSAMGASLGTRLAVQPKQNDTWFEFCNLWSLLIAPSGLGKSPILEATLGPLQERDRQLRQGSDEKAEKVEALNSVIEQQISGYNSYLKAQARKGEHVPPEEAAEALAELKAQIQPVPCERLYVTEFTVEALQVLMQGNPHGLMVKCDELAGLLTQASRAEYALLRRFLLETWSGKAPLSQIRVGRANVDLPNPCLTILGAITPDSLAETVRKTEGQGGDGLLQRFQLTTFPEMPAYKATDISPDYHLAEQYRATIHWLNADTIVSAKTGDIGEIPVVQFSPDASGLFEWWRQDELEPLRRSIGIPQSMRSHVSKYLKLVPALSLILHLADGQTGRIHPAYVEKAIEWARFFISHLERVYSCRGEADRSAVWLLAEKLWQGRVPSPFTERTVYRNEWAGLGREVVKEACLTLADLGWLMVGSSRGPVYRAHEFYINPFVQEPGLGERYCFSRASPSSSAMGKKWTNCKKFRP